MPQNQPSRSRRFARPRSEEPTPASTSDTGEDGATPKPPRPNSKRANVIALLSREGGATIADITQSTGWLPHTARAMLTSLRKQGRNVVGTKTETGMIYRIGGRP